jgi:hypothetical protein
MTTIHFTLYSETYWPDIAYFNNLTWYNPGD